MKKFRGRLWALCLAVVLLITGMPVNVQAADGAEKYPYAVFATKDISFSGNVMNVNGNIHANRSIMYQCINGVVNGTSSSAVASYGANSNVTARNELTQQETQAMLYIGAKLMSAYFTDETKVNVLSKMDSNLNLNANTYSQTTVTLGGNINLNGAAIGAVNNIEIGTIKTAQGYNVNANQAVLYSVKGDIIIDVDNFNFSGLIYAPNGNVEIVSKGNLGIQGVVIAQSVSLQGGNINLQRDNNFAQFVAEAMKDSDSADGEDEPNKGQEGDSSENVSEDSSEEVSETPSEAPSEEPSEEIDYTDTDGDGLIDVIEEEIGTNIEKCDTDGDGLSDFDEIYLTITNPTKMDTDDNGITDDKEDFDGDGLNALDELEIGTLPIYEDTDYDGLLDGEESAYSTDPLKYDTDEDGLSDADELVIGLNPCNPATYGVPDAEYTFTQSIDKSSELLADINTAENAYELSVEAKVSGNLQANLIVQETGYSAVIQNDCMVGMPIELTYGDMYEVEEVTLSFEIKEGYRENELNYFSDAEDSANYSPELVGVKRLQVFKFFEDSNMLLPIESFHDVENNTVKTVVDEFGVYCLIDMEKWILSLAEQGGLFETQPAVMSLDLYVEDEYYEFTEEETLFGPEAEEVLEETIEEVAEEITEETVEEVAEEIAEEAVEEVAEEITEITVEETAQETAQEVIAENIEEISAETMADEVVETDIVETVSDSVAVDVVEVLSSENVGEEIIVRSPVMRSGTVIETPVDIVVLLQITGTDSSVYRTEKSNIIDVSQRLFAKYPNSRISVITYAVNEAQFLGGDDVYWFTDLSELNNALDEIVYEKTWEYCNRGAAFELLMEQVEFRPTATKFVYQMCNGRTAVYDDYFSQLRACSELNIIYSEIYNPSWRYTSQSYGEMVLAAITKTKGISIRTSGTSDDEIWEHIKSNVPFETVEFKAIVATGWETITLDAPLDSENGVDTDGDTLLDWNEVDVDNELLVWDADGSVELPTIQECIDAEEVTYVENGLRRILGAEGFPSDAAGAMVAMMLEYEVMPINSDPTCEDSDGDEMEDYRDSKPLRYDYIPSEFIEYIVAGYIEHSDLRRANDGFTICTKPLGEIMNEMGITAEGYEKTGQDGNLYYFSDWFLYGFEDEEGKEIYSILKMRTMENEANGDASVAVPFREMDITLLRESYDKEKLGGELAVLTEMPDKASDDESVRSYFENAYNQTNYFLADTYVALILERDNVNGNGTFQVPSNVLPRVTERLEESPQIYDSVTGLITISDINNLTLEERQCLLVSRAGTISYNAFAAEIVAHAWAAGKAPEFTFVDDWFYESAKKADLGAAEGGGTLGQIFEYFFAYEDSVFVEQQRGIFGEQ